MLNSQIKLKRLRNPRIKRKRKYPILTGVPAGKVVLFAIDSHEQPHPNRTPSLLHVLPQKLHRRIYRTITQPQINNRELKQEEKENHTVLIRERAFRMRSVHSFWDMPAYGLLFSVPVFTSRIGTPAPSSIVASSARPRWREIKRERDEGGPASVSR